MQPHPPRHTLAALRSVIGVTGKQLAELAGYSLVTIQSVESGRLRMSEALALRISEVTGVSEVWLLKGDPEAPIVDAGGAPYTRDTFENVQAELSRGLTDSGEGTERPIRLAKTIANLHLALQQAEKDKRLRLVDYKLHQAITDIARPYRDFVPGFFGDMTDDSKAMLPIEYPDIVNDLTTGIEALVKRVSSESGIVEQEELSEYCAQIAAVLQQKADLFKKLAKDMAPRKQRNAS